MKKLYVLSMLMLVLASGLLVSCETPEIENGQESKKEMGDGSGAIIIKPKPPINPPKGPIS